MLSDRGNAFSIYMLDQSLPVALERLHNDIELNI